MRNLLQSNLLIFLLITTNLVFAKPVAPTGFLWVHTGPADSTFLKPTDWFLKTEKNQDTFAIFITKEKIVKNSFFKTGLTVNVISDITTKTGITPSKYAEQFISLAIVDKKILNPPWSAKSNPFKIYGVLIRDNIKSIYFTLVANNKTDTLFIFIFEAPSDKWEEDWKNGKIILDNLQIDDQV